MYQNNQCSDVDISCDNFGDNLITIIASGLADVDSDASQKMNEDNKCEDGATCTNTGGNTLQISATDDGFVESYSEQESYQNNDCGGAGTVCENTDFGLESNFIDIVAENQAVVESEAYQTFVQDNICQDGAFCRNEGRNVLDITAIENSFVESYSEQKAYQNNECTGVDTECTNDRFNSMIVDASDQAEIDSEAYQTFVQDNFCEDNAPCQNDVSNTVILVGEDQSSIESYAEQTGTYQNDCEGDDTICRNFGQTIVRIEAEGDSEVGSTGIQNIESTNDCADGASCTTNTNTGNFDVIDIFASNSDVSSDAEQNLIGENNCKGAGTTCQDEGGNYLDIDATGGSSVESESDQTVDIENNCEDEASCSIGAAKGLTTNEILISADEGSDVDSDVDQAAQGQNDCSDADCTILLDNTVGISATGGSEVDADIDQSGRGKNNCDPDSTCDLTLSNTVEVDAEGGEEIDADVEQDATAENNCTTGATCTGTISHSAVITDDATVDQSGTLSEYSTGF